MTRAGRAAQPRLINMKDIDKIKELIKENGLRVTKSRIAVATILIKNYGRPLSSEEIYQKDKSSKILNCDQVSVYRVLHTFESLNLVKKTNFQGEAARYLIASKSSHKREHHEHFFKCDSCNIIESFQGCYVSKKEKELEKSGYTNLHHHLEITGTCPDCTQK